MSRRLVLDWRGNPDLTKKADFFSVGPYASSRPVTGNPNARILVAISPTLMYYGSEPVLAQSYGADLYYAAQKRGALMPTHIVWGDPLKYNTRLFDVTRRGMIGDWLKILGDHFGWSNGYHVDYFTAMSWQFPDLAPIDDVWDRALASLASGIQSTGRLCLGQQFFLSPPIMAANGGFWEQYPTCFRQTFESHTRDVEMFRDFTRRIDDREVLFVSELREPAKFPADYVARWRSWGEAFDLVLCEGRDAAAVGAA